MMNKNSYDNPRSSRHSEDPNIWDITTNDGSSLQSVKDLLCNTCPPSQPSAFKRHHVSQRTKSTVLSFHLRHSQWGSLSVATLQTVRTERVSSPSWETVSWGKSLARSKCASVGSSAPKTLCSTVRRPFFSSLSFRITWKPLHSSSMTAHSSTRYELQWHSHEGVSWLHYLTCTNVTVTLETASGRECWTENTGRVRWECTVRHTSPAFIFKQKEAKTLREHQHPTSASILKP